MTALVWLIALVVSGGGMVWLLRNYRRQADMDDPPGPVREDY